MILCATNMKEVIYNTKSLTSVTANVILLPNLGLYYKIMIADPMNYHVDADSAMKSK
jgi:hypothetical protein